MAPTKASPTLQLDANDNPTIALVHTSRALTIWRTSGVVRLAVTVRTGTSPALVLDAHGDYHVAFVTPSKSVSVASLSGVIDTGLVAAPNSNPSIAVRGDGSVVVVVANTTGLVQIAESSLDGLTFTASPALVITVRTGTSPVVAAFGPTGY
ncbi:MAG: hypothetical protein EBR99_03360, partial [Actinobacteria bacterium]|nr:hypothetical protein [Actinomycetota bacterium]